MGVNPPQYQGRQAISQLQFGLLIAVLGLNLLVLLLVARERRARLRREAKTATEPPIFQPPHAAAPARELPRMAGEMLPDEAIRTLAGIAHSLNNRFSTIHSHASLIDPARLSADNTKSLDIILAEARQGGKLAVNLLDQVVPHIRGRPLPPEERHYDPRRGWQVLLVQQSDAARSAIVQHLEGDGYHVAVASDGIEAWRMIEHTHVDVIISGLRMDTLSGRGFFEQLEEKFPTLAGRVIFLTGDFANPESRAFLENTGQPIVAKPFEPTELFTALHVITKRIVGEADDAVPSSPDSA